MKYFKHLALATICGMTFSLVPNSVLAQSVGIGSTSFTPDVNSILDVRSTDRGVLLPRATSNPAVAGNNNDGLLYFNNATDVNEYRYYDEQNNQWRNLLSGVVGSDAFIINQTGIQTSANFNIDGTGTIGTNAIIGGGIKVGSTAATPAASAGNILMALDDSWIGSGSLPADVRLAFDQTSPELRVLVEQNSITNGGHVALTIENSGVSSGVGMKLTGRRGLAPASGATREAGFIDFENTDGTTATLARVGVTNASGVNTQGSFHISLQSTPSNALTERFVLEHNGDLTIDGKFESLGIKETSDARFKKNIKAISNALSNVMSLEGVTYNWRTDEFPNKSFTDRMEYGVIAQQIEKIVPELVDTDEEGFKSVQYSHMVPLLIEAIKEQQSIINSQSQEIGVLKASVEAISEHIKTAEK